MLTIPYEKIVEITAITSCTEIICCFKDPYSKASLELFVDVV